MLTLMRALTYAVLFIGFVLVRRLVLSGPYQFVRNPMYWGAGLALGGAALFYQSIVLAGYALLFLGVIDLFVRWYEEPTLRRLFGPEYEVYCRGVRRWWPIRPRVRKASA